MSYIIALKKINKLAIGPRELFLLYTFTILLFNHKDYNIICNLVFSLFVINVIKFNHIKISKYCILFALFPISLFVLSIRDGFDYGSLVACYLSFSLWISIVMINTAINRKDVYVAENAVIIGSLILVINDLFLNLIEGEDFNRLGTLTVNTNNMGIALAFSSLFAFNRGIILGSRAHFCVFFILEMLILLTKSRSALVFSLLGIVVIGISKIEIKKLYIKSLIIKIAIISSIILIGIQSGFVEKYTNRFQGIEIQMNEKSSVSIRMEYMQLGFEEFLESPLLGHGVGRTRDFLQGSYFHNTYIQLLYECGLTGLFLFLIPFLAVLIKSIKDNDSIIMAFTICILVEGCFDVFYGNKLYYLIFGLMILRLKNTSLKKAR